MESLEGLWEKFSLSEVEGNMVDLISTPDQPKSFLAAKFLTRRTLNVESVARTFKPLWRTDHGFTIRDMNDNRLVFVFEDEADRERVLMGEPWAYDKHLIILQRIEEDEAIDEVQFCETAFWVQMHGLPIRRMNNETVATIGSSLGSIVQGVESGANVDGGTAMRIRVSLDITKPLCRGRKARFEKDRETWIAFRYERLPNFCYWCGHVTHSDKDCPYWLRNKDSLRLEEQQFGPWLRASNDRPWRKMEVKIDGIARKPPTRQKPPHTPPPHSQPQTAIPTSPTKNTSTAHPDQTHHPNPTPPHNYPLSPPPHISQSHPQPVPPPDSTHTANPQTTLVDFPTNMEVEENPGFTPDLSQRVIRGEDIFENQLREIDQAIEYHKILKENIPKNNPNPIPIPSPTISAEPLPNPSHYAVLGDITNSKPKLTPAKKSWKKLARSKEHYDTPLLEPMQPKRTSSYLEENMAHAESAKKHCGTHFDSLSVAAALQPRREQ